LDFITTIGRHVSVNQMLKLDAIKNRLEREQHLSLLEFNYCLLQAYDFLELNTNHNCVLQIGGSDQWGNIINGVNLISTINNTKAFGLTTHLVTDSSGKK